MKGISVIELTEHNFIGKERHSSKGNQLKWRVKDWWYKADYTGYEGYAEYMCASLMRSADITQQFVGYETEQICYKGHIFRGCKSKNFLRPGWQMITLERLFQNQYGRSLAAAIYVIEGAEERVRFLVEQVELLTGLKNFGNYLLELLTMDAIFLNEDRHMHNIAVLMDPQGGYAVCPFFDFGAALLADTTMDYPLDEDVYELMDQVKSKTVHEDFQTGVEAAERLCGRQIRLRFDYRDILEAQQAEPYYPEDVKKRVQTVLLEQRRRYAYLFQ